MKIRMGIFLLLAALLLSGCAMQTVDQMYQVPKRSADYENLQTAIDKAMADLSFSTPTSGENQQTVQMADLDGDGSREYLIYARSQLDNPLRILVFRKQGNDFLLQNTIECLGSGFEQVEYVDIDGSPGMELVVGRRVSEQVLGAVSVYSFTSGQPTALISANYHKFLTCDLDRDGRGELLILHPGQSESDKGAAVLYDYRSDRMERSREADLSLPADCIKRIMPSSLYGSIPAVYVASSSDGSSIVTDIFALKDEVFTNISFSNESGTSVQTLRNYFVYADDIDEDGILELPSLFTTRSPNREYLIRWFAMDLEGGEVTKMYTFHNYVSGWYLELNPSWAQNTSVERLDGTYLFRIWNSEEETAETVFRIYALGSDEDIPEPNAFILHRTDSTVYAAKLEASSAAYGITEHDLINSFRLIRQDWKTGET